MKNLIENTIVKRLPWFKTWFNSPYYHSLYQHRNDKEAQDFINALIAKLEPTPGSFMLDVGCGNGRHSKHLAAKGFRVAGFDLAFSSIKEAKKFESPALQFRQHDMREPFGNNKFDYVFNLFTSFGYFKGQENLKVIQNIASSLKAGGTVVIDYMNVEFILDNLVAKEIKEIDGIIYDITRWHDEQFIYKKISIDDSELPGPLKYVEQVSKFKVSDFENFFTAAGLKMVNVYGDYNLNEYEKKNSKRLIMIATK